LLRLEIVSIVIAGGKCIGADQNAAFDFGAKTDDPVSMYLQDIYTISLNLAGLPGMSLPVGFVDGLPVGMQLIGNYFDEAGLLNAAHSYQQVTDWHLQAPVLNV
jgi:aspartyl-tRNA(Asn)/glutamyl-tRNA(Gln) amidotransferase subunit A